MYRLQPRQVPIAVPPGAPHLTLPAVVVFNSAAARQLQCARPVVGQRFPSIAMVVLCPPSRDEMMTSHARHMPYQASRHAKSVQVDRHRPHVALRRQPARPLTNGSPLGLVNGTRVPSPIDAGGQGQTSQKLNT
ncbi:hypothetical protein V2G26_011899 [Clonostachys chloroleuca]